MRITVCQWRDGNAALSNDWKQLSDHVRLEGSELVLLPDMPFYASLAGSAHYDPALWTAAVSAHDGWEERFAEIKPTMIAATRPMDFG